MNLRQRQSVEHREDLGFYLRRGEAVARGRNIRGPATEKIGTINPAALGNRRNPTVPERRIAGEAVHHQHWCRTLPGPQVVIDSAVERKSLIEAYVRHK